MNNNLLELGGSVDLIATAICDFDTPTRHYNKGDIVLDLKSINALFLTNDSSSRANAKKLELDYAKLSVTSIQSQYVPIDSQLYDLLGDKEQAFSIVRSEVLPGINGMLLPTTYIADKDSVRIRDIESFEVENNDEMKLTYIKSEEFKDGQVYYIQYNKEVTKKPLLFDSFEADIPYVSLQLTIGGNVDKVDGETYLFIPKTRIHFVPILQFDSNSVSYCTLRFNVVNDESKPKMVF